VAAARAVAGATTSSHGSKRLSALWHLPTEEVLGRRGKPVGYQLITGEIRGGGSSAKNESPYRVTNNRRMSRLHPASTASWGRAWAAWGNGGNWGQTERSENCHKTFGKELFLSRVKGASAASLEL
jgi:hypothetical protein